MEKKISNNNRNIGIELLRMIFSFFILLIHCVNVKNNILIILLYKRGFHVSYFFLISFYFFYNTIKSRNIIKIKLRFLRILIPYFIWTLVIFIINQFFGFSPINEALSFKHLILQYIMGRRIQVVFWFQFNLILITLFFTIISFIFKENFLFILQIIGIIAYYLQYSSLNYNYFISYKFYVNLSLGLIAEMLPIAVTGLFLSSINLLRKLLLIKKKVLLFTLMFLFLILYFDIFYRPKGFHYPGILLNVGAILVFSLFGILFIGIKLNKHFITFISFITNYTGGVYYLHVLIHKLLSKKILLFKDKTYKAAIINYIICYLICLIGNKIFRKTKLKYLFY